jgi:polysaccharide export outer membrane protein
MSISRFILLAIFALWSLFGCAPDPTQSISYSPVATEEYRLGVGDVISIRVFGGEEDLRFDRVRLNDRGKLTLPFGDVAPVGQTTREIEAAITETLKGQYLMKPRVWVNIDEYRPFFMQGQVGRPGAYAYQPGLDINRAITLAGGFRERAAKDKIFLLREQDKATKPVRVNLNTPVRPGDTIIVEESLF